MEMTIDEIYDLVYKSLLNDKEDWSWNDHYHRFKKGVGIPHTVENKEIGVEIWIANGVSFCRIKIPSKVEINEDGRPTITRESELPIKLYKKWKLYRACMGLFKTRKQTWDLPVSKKVVRDSKLNDILN